MMMILRSAFWLTAAYLVIRPDVQLPDAGALSAQAVSAGTQIVATQVQQIECDSLQCVGGKAAIAAVLPALPSAGTPMPADPAAAPVPFPRPRPDRLS
jgi:hypothetical protein